MDYILLLFTLSSLTLSQRWWQNARMLFLSLLSRKQMTNRTIYFLAPVDSNSMGMALSFFLSWSVQPCVVDAVTVNAPLHSQKELAHWTVRVTVQIYACCFSSWLRYNFRTAFILSGRLDIYTWPVKNNENAWMT